MSMATAFIYFVALVSVAVLAGTARWVTWRAAALTAAGLGVWMAYVGLLGRSGVLGDPAGRPPGPVFVLVPVVVYLVAAVVGVRSATVTRIAVAFPTWALSGGQAFRVAVELFLHELWSAGLVPRMLTYSGANVDLYVGLSAPVVAWWSTRRGRRPRWGDVAVIAWNGLGLLALANVVGRAILTTPGPLHLLRSDVPDQMFATFPYMYIPGFFVPLAVTLHVLALRSAVVRRAGPYHGPWT